MLCTIADLVGLRVLLVCERMGMLRDVLIEAVEFALGERCAGCDTAPGTMCESCLASFERVNPPATPAGLPVLSAVVYAGAAARSIRQIKTGRTSVARAFAGLLADAVARADPRGSSAVIPVPTRAAAYRSRGFRVPETLLRAAGVPAYRALTATRRRVADQRELSAEARAENVHGSMRIRRGIAVPSQALVFDDVYTTGATLDEAARVLRQAGCEVIAAVTLAHAVRRRADIRPAKNHSDETCRAT